MMKKVLLLGSIICLVGIGGCDPSPNSSNNGDGQIQCNDEDGDGICDEDEGRAENVDTDGDNTPDYLDTDSDDDGIPDEIERGGAPGQPPRDSDGDKTPDFRDEDSDGNGIPDSAEGMGDPDNDGIPNFADLDDDGDGIPDFVEIGSDPSNPLDSDGDNIPDFRDDDSDDDNIQDRHEGAGDFDEDGTPNYLDDDSDDDGIPDFIEAGDSDPTTPPVDSDLDGSYDFIDRDSDNDGLADSLEDPNGNGIVDPGESDPRKEDTDGDGVSDLIEVAAGTNPQDINDNPQAHGNFVFVVPYQKPTDPPDDTLEFRTSVQFADVYFMFDRTNSMSTERTAFSTGLPQIINELTCVKYGTYCEKDEDCPNDQVCFNNECIQDPLLGDGCVADLWTGMGYFSDCNTNYNMVSLQSDPAVTANAFATIPFPSGGIEAVYQSAACVANPSLCTNSMSCSTNTGLIGCPGYRPDAVRILIHVTDAGNQGSSCMTDVNIPGNALSAVDIKYIGLWGTSDNGGSPCSTAESCLTNIGNASGTLNSNNQPFIYPALDAAVVPMTKQGVLELVRGMPLYVTIESSDQPDDDGDALRFIDYLEVNISGTAECTNVNPTADTNMDSHDDAFPELLGGTPVCWDVHPVAVNDFEEPSTVPKVFIARLTVMGDGSPLDSRDVYFLVPPVIEGPIPR